MIARRVTCCVVCVLFLEVASPFLDAQAPSLSLQEFFRGLVDHYDASAPPGVDDVPKVAERISGARPRDVSEALPAILTALGHPDRNVRIHAIDALFAISQRQDSAVLIKPHLDAILSLLSSPDQSFVRGGFMILEGLRPVPPPEIVPPIVAYLRRTDPGLAPSQTSAVFLLLQDAPENPEVIAAIEEFSKRPIDEAARIATLDAICIQPRKSGRLAAIVIASLRDSSPNVRQRAIYDVRRLGQAALTNAVPDLQRIAVDPNESDEIKAAAQKALRGEQDR